MTYVRVYEVTDVDVALLKSNPPALALKASGTVNSTGWSEAQLSEWVYITPPADGILDFDFLAKKPTGIVFWAFQPIHAERIVQPADLANYWGPKKPLRGVRVHAATKSIEHLFDGDPKEGKFAVLANGDRWPW